MQLRPRTGVEDVDSGEAERRITDVAVSAHELALHEPHVAGEEGKNDIFTRAAVTAPDFSVDVADRRGSLEVEHCRRIVTESGEPGRLHVELRRCLT